MQFVVMLLCGLAFAGSPMDISPETIVSRPGEAHEIHVRGGLGPYRWYSRTGEVRERDGNKFLYVAPRRYGTDRVVFEDRAGQKAEIEVNIWRPFSVSPKGVEFPSGGEGRLSVTGGSGRWEVVAHRGLNVEKAGSARLILRPAHGEGEWKLVLKDTITRETVEIPVHIYGKIIIDELVKSPGR